MKRAILLILLFATPNVISARTLLDYTGQEVVDTDTSYHEFTFLISKNGNRMVMDLKSDLEQGELNVWFGGAGYQVIGNYSGERSFAYEHVIFGPLNDREIVTVKVTAYHATGTWHVRFQEISTSASLFLLLLSGCLVILLTIVITLWWKRYIQASWRWLLVGAGAWFVGVVFKFVVAYLANAPILEMIRSILGNTGYLALGSVYVGLLTGVFEIGMTLVFALIITNMYETPLLIAVKNQNLEIAENLIRHGAEVNFRDKHGATPLHYASVYGYFYLADLLKYVFVYFSS